MKKIHPIQWGFVSIVVLVITVSAVSLSQQRVQSTKQLTVRKPVVADPLDEWKKQYTIAMKVASEVAESDSPENGERLKNDLKALDSALSEYVRVSERLRQKNRALSDTMQFLALQNSIQQESRQYQTISNALKVSHQIESSSIRNMK